MRFALYTISMALLCVAYTAFADWLVGLPFSSTLRLLSQPLGLAEVPEMVIAALLLLYWGFYCWRMRRKPSRQ